VLNGCRLENEDEDVRRLNFRPSGADAGFGDINLELLRVLSSHIPVSMTDCDYMTLMKIWMSI
jgi:hypothetical protein